MFSGRPCGELCNLPTEGFIQQKQRILTWGLDPPKRQTPLLPPVLACLVERILPLNYQDLELEFRMPNTVSYRTKTGHTRKKELILTRRWIHNYQQRVKGVKSNQRVGNIEVITWTIL